MMLAAMTATANAKSESDTLVVTTTPQMHCANCENKIKDGLRFEKGVKGNPEKMKRAFSHAYEQLMEQLPSFDRDDEVLFISKSIGTAVSLRADIEKDIRARHILFTPLMETMELMQQLLEKQGRSRRSDLIIFHGLADPWAADNDSMRVIAEQRGVEYHELPGANHSLETGNPIVDMDSQKKTMEICQRFLYA